MKPTWVSDILLTLMIVLILYVVCIHPFVSPKDGILVEGETYEVIVDGRPLDAVATSTTTLRLCQEVHHQR